MMRDASRLGIAMTRDDALRFTAMRAQYGDYRRHLRERERHRALAPCVVMRHDAQVASLRPHTKLYPEDARKRLGLAVTRAREAAGYPYRPAFAAAAGVSVRSILNLEQGTPVGPSVYEAAARALPNWDEDVPRRVLEGGAPPAITDRPDPTDQPPAGGLRLEGDDLELAVLLGRMTSLPREEIERIIRERQRLREPPTVEQRTGTDR